ncbi:MAG: MerR family regulatory protein [Smithella sp. PtaU1.Bin162]|nr:MAG: MerR family regulatory protein [Smithella sp. PtaU1.Bin162]
MKDKKTRYHMKDVAGILGVSTRTILNWEQAGKIPKAKRDPMSRYRIYSEEDITELRKITNR